MTSLKNLATAGILLSLGIVAIYAGDSRLSDAFMAVALGFGIRSWFD